MNYQLTLTFGTWYEPYHNRVACLSRLLEKLRANNNPAFTGRTQQIRSVLEQLRNYQCTACGRVLNHDTESGQDWCECGGHGRTDL